MSDQPTNADQPSTEQPAAEEPTPDELEEPSTEKDPGQEPKAPKAHDAEPDHEAVGIGVIDSPDERHS